MGWF
jgi:hypothetical protein